MSDSNQLARYDAAAEEMKAAFEGFARFYAVQNPPPEKEEFRVYNLPALIALSVMLFSILVVGGSRSIPIFARAGILVGVAGFVMLDVGMTAYGFIRTSRSYNDKKHKSLQRWINAGLWLSFVILVGANIEAVMKINDANVKSAIDLLLAISSPTLSLITGDILGSFAVEQRSRSTKAEQKYEKSMKNWRAGMLRSWNSQKSKWGAQVEIIVQRESNGISNGISALEDGQSSIPSKSTIGHSKQPDASRRVMEYFQENPEAVDNFHWKAIQKATGAGKSTIYNVLGELRANRSNGHSNGFITSPRPDESEVNDG